ncbi:hypothetical protein [Nocardia rhamnosiphila]|uniref:HEPN AbiU2-like domain-containing protein n=1 Tax=Nocardia rhamnosiphila TaxID=426716 RepID=A0ABV2WVQ0_9NOCA
MPSGAVNSSTYGESDVVDLHQAIGLYITAFSELIEGMRSQIYEYFDPPSVTWRGGSYPLLDILFANMTANPIVESFFAMSTHVADLDEPDTRIRNALKRQVQAKVSFRNDLAHADWSVGWRRVGTDELVPHSVRKIKTHDGVPRLSDLGLTANDIGCQIKELRELSRDVSLFGEVCRFRQRRIQAHVSDILELMPLSPAGGVRVDLRDEWGMKYEAWLAVDDV